MVPGASEGWVCEMGGKIGAWLRLDTNYRQSKNRCTNPTEPTTITSTAPVNPTRAAMAREGSGAVLAPCSLNPKSITRRGELLILTLTVSSS